MGSTVISLDEARALRQEEQRHDAAAAERAHNLAQARAILHRLGGYDALDDLQTAEAGLCDDCGADTGERWNYGRLEVCRSCATARARAAAKTRTPARTAEPGAAHVPGLFYMLVDWVTKSHLAMTEHELRGHLNSYRLTADRPALTNLERRTLIRLHRKLRDRGAA